jgi:uridine kinase
VEDRQNINYDHPKAFDTDLLVAHLKDLLAGRSVERPEYAYSTHSRCPRGVLVKPADILLVEGILVLEDVRLRDLMDIKLFIDTDPDERFIRRLRRDLEERGRSIDSVIAQYQRTVKPMHLEFVEPSKRYADVIIPEGGHNKVAMDLVIARIRALLQEMAEERGQAAVPSPS